MRPGKKHIRLGSNFYLPIPIDDPLMQMVRIIFPVSKCQKQPPEVFYKESCSQTFRKKPHEKNCESCGFLY